MKTALALIIILNSAFLVVQEAEFSFAQKTSHKFEKTKAGPTLSHEFKFTNSGDAPLIITDYKVACKCTRAIFKKEPIMPGETSSIHIEFDTEGKIGWQDRVIEIYSNAKKSPLKLRIKVMVETD